MQFASPDTYHVASQLAPRLYVLSRELPMKKSRKLCTLYNWLKGA